VLEWIDKAGYACAVAWRGSYSVTAYVGNVSFTRPVQVGDIVEAAARIVQTGRSSMNIMVTVRSGTIASTLLNQLTECLMISLQPTLTADPRPVATWTAATEEDHQRQTAALQLKGVRSDIEEAMATQRYTDAGSAPRIVHRFLAAPTDINLAAPAASR
jgi:acyl-CoA hydrolase